MIANQILIFVKCIRSLYENIVYFVSSALIKIRFDVSQLLTLLSSWLRVNVNSITFSSANEVDRELSSANSINLNKDDEFGRSFINIRNNNDCVCVLPDLTWLPLLGVGRKSWYIIRNNNGPRTDPCGTSWLIEEEEEVIHYLQLFNFF